MKLGNNKYFVIFFRFQYFTLLTALAMLYYYTIVSIRGQAPDSEGGSDLDKIFRGEDFFGFLLAA